MQLESGGVILDQSLVLTVLPAPSDAMGARANAKAVAEAKAAADAADAKAASNGEKFWSGVGIRSVETTCHNSSKGRRSEGGDFQPFTAAFTVQRVRLLH